MQKFNFPVTFESQLLLDQLLEFMGHWGKLREWHERMGTKADMALTPEEFLLDHGRAFVNRTLLDDKLVHAGTGQCYDQAWSLCENDAQMDYCEGFVAMEGLMLPILHGWCVDERGFVHDPSIDQHRGAVYQGIVFRKTYACKVWNGLVQEKLIGILPNAGCLNIGLDEIIAGIQPRNGLAASAL